MNYRIQNLFFTAIALIFAALGVAQNQSAPGTDRQLKKAPPAIQQIFNEANIYVRSGEFSKAQEKLNEAGKRADQLPPDPTALTANELKTEVKIRQAQLLMNGATKERLEASLKLFDEVAFSGQLASPSQKAVAQVNASFILMELERFQEAADRMKSFDWSQIDVPQWPLLHFNYGRALEKAGQPEAAIAEYAKSVAGSAAFEPAVTTFAAGIVQRNSPKIFEFGELLIDNGAPQCAINVVASLLRSSALKNPDAERDAMRVLLIAWSRVYTEPEPFERQQSKLITAVPANSAWSALLEDVRRARIAELSLERIRARHPGDLKPLMPFDWSTSPERGLRDAFASFLAATAAPFLQSKAPKQRAEKARAIATIDSERKRQAFARVYGAWTISPSDLALARQVAALAHDFQQEVDPEGVARSQLIDTIMVEKGRSYRVPVKSEKDWENLLRLHTFLGLQFEAEKNWGDENNPRSSIGQWTFGVEAEKRIRELKSNANYRAPGLYERLAFSLQTKGRSEEAFARYVDAGEGYLTSGNVPLARRAANAASELPVTATNEEKTRLAVLNEKIKARGD
jgi:hypothetical protein